MRARLVLPVLLVLLVGSVALADGRRVKITLKGGEVLEGDLEDRKSEVYRISVNGTVRTIKEEDVESVDFLPETATIPESCKPFEKGARTKLLGAWGREQTFRGGPANRVVFSPDGKLLL